MNMQWHCTAAVDKDQKRKGPSINDVASLEGGGGGQIDDMGRYEGGRCQKNPISSIQNWQIMIFF